MIRFAAFVCGAVVLATTFLSVAAAIAAATLAAWTAAPLAVGAYLMRGRDL